MVRDTGWREWTALIVVLWLGGCAMWSVLPFIRGGPPEWMVVGGMLALFAWWVMAATLPAPDPNRHITVNAQGVRRRLPKGGTEAVVWSELTAVHVVTTAEGPMVEDLFFLLEGSNGEGCALPHGAVVQFKVLEALQQLPGFDAIALITAMGSTEEGWFTVWKGEAGQGRVVAEAIEGQTKGGDA